MQQEYEALIKNGTWTLCPKPPHQNLIRNKWVYKIKRQLDGTIDRFKARLVAKGFYQRSGIDYTKTFSPMIKPATIRLVLALAVQFDWNIKQLDVSNAFLHGTLNEDVFMEQPQGFVDPYHPTFVCKLHKALYGLKQAPQAWFNRVSLSLQHLGFVGSLVDSFPFIFHSNNVVIFLLVYVDDILVTRNNKAAISSLIYALQQEFLLKDYGELTFFLGIEAARTPTQLHLRQTKYITDLLHKTGMVGAKPYLAPCVSGSQLSSSVGDPIPDPSIYRQVVETL
jgi:hypothetical protein